MFGFPIGSHIAKITEAHVPAEQPGKRNHKQTQNRVTKTRKQNQIVSKTNHINKIEIKLSTTSSQIPRN